MIHTTLAVAALAGSISQAPAQLRVIETPIGTTPSGISGVADGGATLLASFTTLSDPTLIGAVWNGHDWRTLQGNGVMTLGRALSADGSAVLYSDIGGVGLVLERNGSPTTIAPAFPDAVGAALTRDGSTVLFATGAQGEAHTIRRWRGGVTTTALSLGNRYRSAPTLLVGDRDDRFVFSSDIANDTYGAGGPRRSAVVSGGVVTEIPTLANATFVNSSATAMSADASVVIGLEQAWDGVDDPTRFDARSWVYRDGALSELTASGFDSLTAMSISDDGSRILAYGLTIDAFGDENIGSLLMHADGRVESVTDLLADAGLVLDRGDRAYAERLSADGNTIAGLIARAGDTVRPQFAFFTLTVPAPAGLLPLAGLVALARRRR